MKAIRQVDGRTPLRIPATPPAWWPESATQMRQAFRALLAEPGDDTGTGSHMDPAPAALIRAALGELPVTMAWNLPEGVFRFLLLLRERLQHRATLTRIPGSYDDQTSRIAGLLVIRLLS